MPNPTSIAGVIRERLRELGCAWCKGPIGETEPVTEVCMRLIHDSPCLIEFDTFTHSEHDPDSLASHLRTSVVNTIKDDEPVMWGEWIGREPDEKYETKEVRWGGLSSYERHTVERQSDGRLVGGYDL